MKAAYLLVFLGCIPAYAQEPVTQALIDLQVQQANQLSIQLMTQQSASAASLHGVTREPLFSVKPGKIAPGTKIRIRSFTRCVSIFYTVDGSTPTAKSTQYRGPIRIASSMQLKAIAFGQGMAPSLISIADYTVPAQAANTGPA
jgi:hypothetical protein